MPPRRDFRSKKTLNVVSFKGGKAVRKSKLSVPVRYSIQRATDCATASPLASTSSSDSSQHPYHDLPVDFEEESTGANKKAKVCKIKIKRRLKAYHVRKERLAESWLNVRDKLVSALLTRHSLPIGQMCTIPKCEREASGRCLHCGPAQFLCEEHMNIVHAGGRSLHQLEIWKDERYIPYQFGECVWTTPHNHNHGYVRDIIAVDSYGLQHAIKIKCCEHEPEAITLVRNGFWPSTPKQPQVAFDLGFMNLLQYLFLECRVSLKSIYQALQWLAPSLSKVYVKDIYRLLVGDCFCEFRYITSILNNLKQFNPLLESEHECPACPKEDGSIFISVDALFGCVRKCSAGTSGKDSNHGEELFISQVKVDTFLASYNRKSYTKSMEQCNQFQAGSSLRSKNKSKKLDETALFGASCKHEVPLKFFSLKRGEEIGNAVFLLKWIKEMVDNKSIHVYFFYDIACVLDTHLRNTHQESILDKVALAFPAFHCYGHKVSCQVNYSGRRLEGFGMSDGEVMERLWSYLRPTGKITKEMTPAHRVDTLTDFLIHFARKSISALGDRLCDHFKKAVETKKETEDQLNLLIVKLNETGNKVEISTIEEWSNKEKTAMTKTSFTGKPDGLSGSDAYPEKLRQYYSVRTSLQKSNPGSDTWSILTVQLERLNQQLKKLEIGQARWSPDNPLYLAYIHELHDKRQKDLLLSMHSKCSERWFLLQLMKKYADGQAIARRLCSQISKTTNAVKQLVKEYERPQTSTGSKYPSKVLVEDALDINSSMWRTIDSEVDLPSAVPYCVKRQLIDLVHINNRCNEEISIIQEEMRRILKFYERKIEGLEMWSKEMRVRRTDSAECRGLLSIVLTKLDELRAFSGYLRELFSASEKGNLQTSMKEESGILQDMEDFSDNTDSQIESDDDDEDVAEELGESEVFKDLRSVLSAEFGSDSESDSGNSDSDGELNPMI